MSVLVHINDIHSGVVRSGGTTPTTAWQLRQYVLQRLTEIVKDIDDHLIINGDLFDTFSVPIVDFLETFYILRHWVRRTKKHLYLVPGNHDLSKTTTIKSSFQALCELLSGEYHTVHSIFVPTTVQLPDGFEFHIIPHLPNQETFDLALSRVPAVKYLFLHCNYDNKFAAQSDQSLNLSSAQAQASPAQRIIIAHEHQRKIAGKVILPGNQFPTSVADCLGNDVKYMVRVFDNKVEYVPTWAAQDQFVRWDWRDLATMNPTDGKFVRIEGKASPAEAPAVVTAISKLRSTSSALVITNAVEIESEDDAKLAVSLEQIKSFDVMTALYKYLTKEEGLAVKKLLEQDHVS